MDSISRIYQAARTKILGCVAWRAETLFKIVYTHPGFVNFGASELVARRSRLPGHFEARRFNKYSIIYLTTRMDIMRVTVQFLAQLVEVL